VGVCGSAVEGAGMAAACAQPCLSLPKVTVDVPNQRVTLSKLFKASVVNENPDD
jgi:hypothetical protein